MSRRSLRRKKNILRLITVREIRKTLGRFLAIFAIVALGTGFFSGLRITTPVMIKTVDWFLQENQLFDYRMISTLGWNESEVSRIRASKGVRAAEGAWQYDVIIETVRGETAVFKAHSLTAHLNGIRLKEGRMPETASECVMDAGNPLGCRVGDTIRLSEENEKDTAEAFVCRAFTVTGFADSSLYLNFERGTTSIGNGSVAGYIYLPAEAFSNDYYTDIYVRLDDDSEIYSGQYEELMDSGRSEWEETAQEAADARYDRLYDEAETELEDARAEYEEKKADGEQELIDAEQELADAEKELADGKQELADGKQELADAKQELEDAKKELQDGRDRLAESEEQLNTAWQELYDGYLELEENAGKLEEARIELEDTDRQLTEGEEELRLSGEQLEAAYAELEANREQLDAAEAQLTSETGSLEGFLQQLDAAEASLTETDRTLAETAVQLESSRAELETGQQALTQAALMLEEGGAELDRQEEELNAGEAAGYLSAEEAEAARQQLLQERAGLEQEQAVYEENLAAYEAGLAQYTEALTEYETGKAEWEAQKPAIEAKVAEGRAAYDMLTEGRAAWEAGLAEYEAGLEQYEQGAAELEYGRAAWEAGLEEYNSAVEQYNAGAAEYEAGLAEYENGLAEYQQGEADLQQGETDLQQGEQDYEEGRSLYEENQSAYRDGLKEYREGLADYEEGKKTFDEEIADAEKKLADAEKELADFSRPDTWLLERNTNIAYACFESDSQIVRQIAGVFPVFFLLVAALVCMTTMTRMVEEQRSQIGVLKGLGYSSWNIMKGFLTYAGTAAALGCAAGYAAGVLVFPTVIWQAYQIMYIPIALRYKFDPLLFGVVMAAALACCLGTTYLSCRSAMRECAAGLMRPRTPKAGRRILLERIPILWDHLGFMRKVSLRNIFRYKKRLFMMVLGIGGCTALLLTGFGLKDSIQGFAQTQFNEIQTADAEVNWRNMDGEEALPAILETVRELDAVCTPYVRQPWDILSGRQIKSIDLIAAEEPDHLTDFFRLHGTDGTPLSVPGSGGALISQSLAERYGLSDGDTLELRNEDMQTMTLTVRGVFENHVYNYVIVSAETLRGTVKDAQANGMYVTFPEGTDLYRGQAALAGCEQVTSVTLLSELRDRLARMMSALNYVVLLVIASAAGLAFVVLYNLTNINIIERLREIATIKVLGFFRKETSAYILRENLLLTAFGTAAGLGMGVALHRFVMAQIEVDLVCFPVRIAPLSFLWAVLLTFGFTGFVNFVMEFRLEKINMAESLKSVE